MRTGIKLTDDSHDIGWHILVTTHEKGNIRAECTCKRAFGPWRPTSPENYAVVKADHAEAHAGAVS
jgi:hypothetical protein